MRRKLLGLRAPALPRASCKAAIRALSGRHFNHSIEHNTSLTITLNAYRRQSIY